MSLGKIEIGGTPEELAKTLRNFASMTASGTQNWDNYEAICLDILKQIFAAGDALAAKAKAGEQ